MFHVSTTLSLALGLVQLITLFVDSVLSSRYIVCLIILDVHDLTQK